MFNSMKIICNIYAMYQALHDTQINMYNFYDLNKI
jgi:hypothetical protein